MGSCGIYEKMLSYLFFYQFRKIIATREEYCSIAGGGISLIRAFSKVE
jgi:hypothetical protein